MSTNQSASLDTTDRNSVARLREAWVAAVAAKNADALRDLLTDDYEVWAHGVPAMSGRDAAADAMRGAMARYDHIAQHFEPVETVIAGDWAFERGIESMTITPMGGGQAITLQQRALLIAHRDSDGRWRYARGMTNGLPAPAPA